jgi:outer membrane protein assembly factor BamE (lipoprotein component of BamABCDE complex)
MNPEVATAISEFRTRPGDRLKQAKTLLPMIKAGQTAAEVQALLGLPSTRQSDYALFYSSTLVVSFDHNNKVTGIASDLLDEASQSAGAANDPDVVGAIQQFKSRPYSRQEPARKLIPFIKPGMPQGEVETFLGPPNRKSWEYSLMTSSSSTLVVRFDQDERVQEAAIFPPS